MRMAFLVYGAVYAVIEMVGYRLALVGWPAVTALDVAAAMADAFLVVAVLLAVLLALDLLRPRWRAWVRFRRPEPGRPVEGSGDRPRLGVRSWRPVPLALPPAPSRSPAAPAEATRRRETGNPYLFGGHRFPEGPGRLL